MKFRIELLMSVTAIITAVAAVFVSIAQTEVMSAEAEMEREHQRLSVMPSVWLETNNSSSINNDEAPGSFEFIVINHGLGPASLKYFTIQRDGKYIKNWSEWLSFVEKDDVDRKGVKGLSFQSLPASYVLPQGTEVQAYTIRAQSKFIRKIEQSVQDSIYSVCFCSFYNDCWLSKGLNVAPDPIDQCEIDSENRFVSERN
tara:strand:- start:319 stop:918 length:600 start_codon:yes stop_codon:yes gene_type:complete